MKVFSLTYFPERKGKEWKERESQRRASMDKRGKERRGGKRKDDISISFKISVSDSPSVSCEVREHSLNLEKNHYEPVIKEFDSYLLNRLMNFQRPQHINAVSSPTLWIFSIFLGKICLQDFSFQFLFCVHFLNLFSMAPNIVLGIQLLTCWAVLQSRLIFQSLSHVGLFATLWTVACQASLFPTVFGSLLKFMSIELVILPNHLLLLEMCHLLLILT